MTGDGPKLLHGSVAQRGVLVSMHPWVVAGQPLYGDEPDKFVPERWLCGKEESEAACTERTNAWKRADIVSSHGKYSSSGKNVAIWEMYKVLPTLLLNFDVELQDQDKSGNVIDRFIVRQTRFNCVLHPRV